MPQAKFHENASLRGTRAEQATAVPVKGALYFVTDEKVTERWTGTAWEDWTDGGGADSLDEILLLGF